MLVPAGWTSLWRVLLGPMVPLGPSRRFVWTLRLPVPRLVTLEAATLGLWVLTRSLGSKKLHYLLLVLPLGLHEGFDDG